MATRVSPRAKILVCLLPGAASQNFTVSSRVSCKTLRNAFATSTNASTEAADATAPSLESFFSAASLRRSASATTASVPVRTDSAPLPPAPNRPPRPRPDVDGPCAPVRRWGGT